MAGGTDLLVLLRQKAVSCDSIMDVKMLPGLNDLRVTDEALEIGAALPLNHLLTTELPMPQLAALRQAAGELANQLLRNRATLAGNICNASPGGDMLPACLVLGASLNAVSPRGSRAIALKDFFVGVKRHVLEPDEVITHIRVPILAGKSSYLKHKRIRGHDLAQVGVAGFLGNDGTLKLALGAVAITPLLLDDLGPADPASLAARRDEIAEAAYNAARPIDDIRASGAYRSDMVRLLVGQMIDGFLGSTAARKHAGGLDYAGAAAGLHQPQDTTRGKEAHS
jgi:carbon-monoxide dehydrogenase medium subunit